jgi:hypothetical protein
VKDEGNDAAGDGSGENDVEGYEHVGLLAVVLGERGAPFEAHHQVCQRP